MRERRRQLDQLEGQLLGGANAFGTRRNHETHKNRYFEFCDFSKIRPFPVTEFKLCKFATFMSQKVKTVESIKSYCTTICQESELKGYRPARRGVKFYRCISGIRQALRHKVKRAEPMTNELLEKILKVVKLHDDKEFATWVTMLSCYCLMVRKSNLVPLSQVHDMVHNVTRSDIRYDAGVMVIVIRWSKTNQFGDDPMKIPIIADKTNELCPVHWILHLTQRIPAHRDQNLFCYHKQGKGLVPVTYRNLMEYMRKWLKLVGVQEPTRFSSHSLRRGACTTAFDLQIGETAIMRMGFWKSQCYKNYIQDDMKSRVKTWFKFARM